MPKSPDNLILGSTGTGYAIVARTLEALRLAKPGAVGVGDIFHARSASFNVGIGGLGRAPSESPRFRFGRVYRLGADDAEGVGNIVELLDRRRHADPKRVAETRLAFRRFGTSYTRPIQGREDQLVDLITALETLLGSDDELAFKLSFRIASLLGGEEKTRVELFDLMREFYRVRSLVVHGGDLKPRHTEVLGRVGTLEEIVRRLLVAVLHAEQLPESPFARKYVESSLDRLLLHSDERGKLRAALGLDALAPLEEEDAEGPVIAAFDRPAGPPGAQVFVAGSDAPAEFN